MLSKRAGKPMKLSAILASDRSIPITSSGYSHNNTYEPPNAYNRAKKAKQKKVVEGMKKAKETFARLKRNRK